MPNGDEDRIGHQTFEWLLRLKSKSRARQHQPSVLAEAVTRQPSVGSTPLTANIVTNAAEICELTAFVTGLVPEPGMLAPRFFLASLLPRHCRPCVVVVSQGRRVAGLLYAAERL